MLVNQVHECREVYGRPPRAKSARLAGRMSHARGSKGVINMTVTRILIAGLFIGGATLLSADAALAAEVSLETPITRIELDEEGNVKLIEFGDDTRMEAGKDYQLGVDVGDRDVLGVRRLPFQILKDPSSGSIEVVVPFDYGSSYGSYAYCPHPCSVEGGRCKCPKSLDAYRYPALVEFENSEFAVVMWPPE
jgi:hypothetical protein